jgi:hypothetical protein
MRLSSVLQQFFDQYLPHLLGSSEHTICAYRDTLIPCQGKKRPTYTLAATCCYITNRYYLL